MTTSNQRYSELDFLRGMAVLAMIAYHLCFDLSLYYGYPIAVETGGLQLFARATATLFLTLVGICFVISWERTEPSLRKTKSVKRAGIIILGGMLVTAVTLIIDPTTFVIFGILHLIGVATLIQYVARPLRRWNLLLGALIFSTAFVFPTSGLSSALLLPFGIMSKGFTSVDYYPLLPWLGPIFIGMGLGDVLYIPERHTKLALLDALQWPRWILWFGRKSLWIYFIHQPILLLILWMLLGK